MMSTASRLRSEGSLPKMGAGCVDDISYRPESKKAKFALHVRSGRGNAL